MRTIDKAINVVCSRYGKLQRSRTRSAWQSTNITLDAPDLAEYLRVFKSFYESHERIALAQLRLGEIQHPLIPWPDFLQELLAAMHDTRDGC